MINQPTSSGDYVGGDKLTVGGITDSIVAIGAGASVNVNIAPVTGVRALHQLRAPIADFVGRVAETEQLVTALSCPTQDTAALAGIFGMGGIGKTECALVVAQRLTAAFQDAQIVIALQGTNRSPVPPAQALRQVIQALDPAARLPEDLAGLQGLYRSLLTGKRVLVLADDAANAAQVRPLLPPVGCTLLITSRQRWALPGMLSVALSELTSEQSIQLLLAIAPRIGQAAPQLAQACGHLPLALRVSASVLASDVTRHVARYLRRLSNERERLAQLRDPNDPSVNVESSIALSYNVLPPAAKQALCQCAVFPGSFDHPAASAVVVPSSIHGSEVDELLSQLYLRSLLGYDQQQEQYVVPPLVRAFALARLRHAEAVRLRHARYYLAVAQRAAADYLQGGNQVLLGLALFDRERVHIDAGWEWARAYPATAATDELILGYTQATLQIGNLRYHKQQRIHQLEAALEATRRLGDHKREGRTLTNLGAAYAATGALERAAELYHQALAITLKIDDQDGEANTRGNLANVYARQGHVRDAIEHYQRALTLKQAIGDLRGEAAIRTNLGLTYATIGDIFHAIEHYEQALNLKQAVGDRRGAATVQINLGLACEQLGAFERAKDLYDQALTIARDLTDQALEGIALGNLANTYVQIEQPQQALAYYEQALVIKRAAGDQEGEAITSWDLGILLMNEGDYQRAVKLLQHCVNYERTTKHPHAERDAAMLEQIRAQQSGTSGASPAVP